MVRYLANQLHLLMLLAGGSKAGNTSRRAGYLLLESPVLHTMVNFILIIDLKMEESDWGLVLGKVDGDAKGEPNGIRIKFGNV